MKKGELILLLGTISFILIIANVSAATYTCTSCSTCTQYLANASTVAGDTIQLINSITMVPTDYGCIDFGSKSGVTFDCKNFSNFIKGPGGYTDTFGKYGIGLYNENDTVKNCNISGFYDGVNSQSAINNSVLNSIITNCSANGIEFYSNTYNNTISNVTLSGSLNAVFHSSAGMSIASPNTIIMNVTSYNNDLGGGFYGSNTTFKNNNFSGNTYSNLGVSGPNHIIDTSNIIDFNGKLYYNYSISNYIYNPTSASNAATIVCVNCNNVTIKDLNLSHHNRGIVLSNSTNSIIRNITASNNPGTDGIYITGISSSYSQNNTIINANLSNNGNGIHFYFASNITLINVSATNNTYGVYFDYSSNNTLTNTNMSGNTYDFYIMDITRYNHIIGASNTIDFNAEIYYNYNLSNYIYNSTTAPNAGIIICAYCNNVTIRDLNLNHPEYAGIHFYNTGNSTIQNLTLVNYSRAIKLEYSSNNLLDNLTAFNTDIYTQAFSNNNTFSNINVSLGELGINQGSNNTLVNIIQNNGYNGIVVSGDNNSLSNVMAINSAQGFTVSSGDNNTLSNITVRNSTGYGIYFIATSGNILKNSNITNSSNVLAFYATTEDNSIYNNYFSGTNLTYIPYPQYTTFINNSFNTTKTCGLNIIGGPYIGGNFWAFPNGTGFSQTCTDSNSDGICDANYTIDSSNYDSLPLTSTSAIVDCNPAADNGTASSPSGSTTGQITQTVQTQTFATILAFHPALFNISVVGLDLTKITLVTIIDITNVQLTILKANNPSNSEAGLPPGVPYQTFKITSAKLNGSNVANVTFEFKVDKNWLRQQNSFPSNIKLFRKPDSSNSWNPLATVLVNSDNNYYYYSALSPGFSTFLIFADKSECFPGEMRCSTNEIQLCLQNFTWSTQNKCDYLCVNAECVSQIGGIDFATIFYGVLVAMLVSIILVIVLILRNLRILLKGSILNSQTED